MRYFLFLLCISFSLFPNDDWEDKETFQYGSFVTYAGLELRCDRGCGDPEYDRNADKINYLCCEWLRKPINPDFYSRLRWRHAENVNLQPWESSTLSRSDWEGSFERFEEYEDEGMSHGEFLKTSSEFLEEISNLAFVSQEDLQHHKKNIQKIQELQTLGARFIEWNDEDEVEGYERGSFNSSTIRNAMDSETRAVSRCERELECYEQYRDYAEDTFRLVDATFKKIFINCLEKHQSEGITFRAALNDLMQNNLDDALERLEFLVKLAETKNWDGKLIAKLQLLQGEVENELCLYADAIVTLTSSIQRDPSCKETYLERARAYFETGEFESAFQDFLSSGIKSTPIDPQNKSLIAFASGIMSGTLRGGQEGLTEFIPSLITSLKMLGSGVWAFVQNPVEISSEFANAVYDIVESVQSFEDFSSILIPELKDLVSNWEEMSSFQKGGSCGHIIGKYGIDILLPLGVAKGGKAFVKLRQASAVHVFESYVKTETNALQLQKKAQLALARRTGQLKNAAYAEIEDRKITKYALEKSGKSNGFREILGYNESNWEELQDSIKKGILKNKAKFHKIDQYGVKFSVDMLIEGPKGKANVRTGWIYDLGSDKPRLTTLFVCTK